MKVNKLIQKHQLGKQIFPSDNTRVSTPKIIPEGEIIKFNHTNPETGDINPFYNRVRDEYGIVPIPEVQITAPLTEQAKRNAEARRGMRYVDEGRRNAAPYIAPIVGAAGLGAMASAGLMSPLITPLDVGLVANNPKDPMNWIPFGVGATSKAPKVASKVLNNLQNGNLNLRVGNWSLMMPGVGKENTVFRQGGLDMLDDAFNRGIVAPITEAKAAQRRDVGKKGISLLTKSFTKNVMFNRKNPFYGNYLPFEQTKNKALIIGDINNPNIEWRQNFHKGHKYIFEPYTNGELKAPISEFEFYKRAPFNFGWVKQSQ